MLKSEAQQTNLLALNATTADVSRILTESSSGVENISDVIKEITLAAGKSSGGANETLKAAKDLGELSQELSKLIEEAKA